MKVCGLMKVTSVVLAVIVIVLGIYGLVTKNYAAVPYTQFLTGLMFLVLGVIQFRENRKGLGIFLFVVAGFSLFVSIAAFL